MTLKVIAYIPHPHAIRKKLRGRMDKEKKMCGGRGCNLVKLQTCIKLTSILQKTSTFIWLVRRICNYISWWHSRLTNGKNKIKWNWFATLIILLTILPARMPQVSILAKVFDSAIFRNLSISCFGTITVRRP